MNQVMLDQMEKVWIVVNSNIFVALLTILFGCIFSLYLTERWQNRKTEFEKKHRAFIETVSCYQLLLKVKKELDTDVSFNWNAIHAQFLAANKVNKIVYDNDEVFKQWDSVASNFANVFQHIADGAKNRVINKLNNKIIDSAHRAESLMLIELKKS